MKNFEEIKNKYEGVKMDENIYNELKNMKGVLIKNRGKISLNKELDWCIAYYMSEGVIVDGFAEYEENEFSFYF